MSTLTIRLPDEKHERLKALAKSNSISINKPLSDDKFRSPSSSGNRTDGAAIGVAERRADLDAALAVQPTDGHTVEGALGLD
ncbi:MAG: toxin-antitoxin system HicB family antitoxin [Aquabacterium sp.]|nr:toxin-antitoxin system HicB family antitoxin [Aquabacterium sp.]